ncbi:ABC transporter ATP-binding protein [bacterium]|nr:ABC transporter ATP-binding protein [bacterium]NCQ55919.1 ABC transporter ATP-binding protein [Candidatus Parcubacteria bacterium]NCS67944.1 ABC transporter ATP-binding protein [Candidatus Peregrinibacteria bacterium]NCS96838.1 ABC transporter ATP-binding protein [bacterium]
MIKIRDIKRTYNEGTEVSLTVLHGIKLDITQGEFVSIMGPSGSGKSTLMHILGFLDSPSEGTYEFENINTTNFTENQLADIRNEKIGFVFQAFHLLPRTTSLENVMLPLMYAGVPEKQQRERATKALEMVGLGDRLDHTPAQLSGGQQQRVSIARALVNEPKVIFADEPTGNLDTASSYEIMSIFEALNKQGKTIIMVTHEDDIASYTKRIVYLRDGNIERDEINKKPKSAEQSLKAYKAKHKDQ